MSSATDWLARKVESTTVSPYKLRGKPVLVQARTITWMAYKDKQKKRERHREYMRERYRSDPEHRLKQQVRARTKSLERPSMCSRCSNPFPEGHHPSYEEPKNVVWLCRSCHLIEHATQKSCGDGATVGSNGS